MKKYLILMLLLAMAGTLAWAGGSNGGTSAAADGPIKISLLSREDPGYIGDFSDKRYHAWIMDRFGVDIQLNPVSGASDAYRTRYMTLVLSGDLPDIISGLSHPIETINQQGQDGALEELSQYYPKMPVLNAFFAKYPAEKKHLAANKEGDTYTFGSGYGYKPLVNHTVSVRNDMLKEVGFDITTVETFEDYIEMFKALRDANDGVPPVGNRKGLKKMLGFGMHSIGRKQRYEYFDPVQEKFFHSWYDDVDVKYVVNWYRTLFEEGVYHPDSVTMSEETFEPELASGGKWQAVVSDNAGYGPGVNANLHKKGLFPEMDYVPVPPPKYKGKQYMWPHRYLLGPEHALRPDPDPAKIGPIIEMMDWVNTKEALWVTLYGPENEAWFKHTNGNYYTVYLGADGKPSWPSDAKPPVIKNQDDFTQDRQTWGVLYKWRNMVAPKQRKPAGEVDRYFDMTLPYYNPVQGEPAPLVNFTPDELTEMNNLRTVLNTASFEWVAKFITGIEPMSKWGEFQAQLEKLGVKRFEELWNTAYKRG